METGVSISVFNLKHVTEFVDIQDEFTLMKWILICMCCFNLVVFFSKLNVLLEIFSSVDSCKYVCRELLSKKLKQNPDRFSDNISSKDSAPQGGACAAIPSRICLPRALRSCRNLLYTLLREHSALKWAQLAGEKLLMHLSPNLTLLSMPLINFINY